MLRQPDDNVESSVITRLVEGGKTKNVFVWQHDSVDWCVSYERCARQSHRSAVICNFWHLGTLTLSPEHQSAQMSKITNYGLTQSGTGCFIAVVGIRWLIHQDIVLCPLPLGISPQWSFSSRLHARDNDASDSMSKRLSSRIRDICCQHQQQTHIMFISQTAVVRTITTDHFTDTECGINTSHNPSFRHHNMRRGTIGCNNAGSRCADWQTHSVYWQTGLSVILSGAPLLAISGHNFLFTGLASTVSTYNVTESVKPTYNQWPSTPNWLGWQTSAFTVPTHRGWPGWVGLSAHSEIIAHQ